MPWSFLVLSSAAAVLVAGVIEQPAELDDLLPKLKSPDVKVREGAINKLTSELEPPLTPKVLLALIDCLKDESESVKREASWYLRKFGPAARAAVPALRAMLSEKNPESRRWASQALVQIGIDDLKGEPWVIDFVRDSVDSIRGNAGEFIARYGKPDDEVLATALTTSVKEEKDESTKVQLASGLLKTRPGDKTGIEAVLRGVESKNRATQEHAIRCANAGLLPLEPRLKVWELGIRSSHPFTSHLAAAGVVAAKEVGPQSIPMLEQALAKGGDGLLIGKTILKWDPWHKEAAKAVQRSYGLLLLMLSTEVENDRRYATEALGTLVHQDPKAVSILQGLREDADPVVRRFALSALDELIKKETKR